MNCVKCKVELKEGSRFCNICGAPQTAKCVKCGSDLEAGSRFCNACGAPQTDAAPAAPVTPAVSIAPAAPAVSASDVPVKRAKILIISGDFAKAVECCNKALETDPENSQLYLLLMMGMARVAEKASLKFLPNLPENPNFKLARQFASPELAAQLDSILAAWKADQPLLPLRAACVQRQRMLRSLPAQLVGNAQKQLEERLAAEQALMKNISPKAAQREANATQAFCKNLFVPIFNTQLEQLKKQKATDAGQLADRIRALIDDPAASCEDMLQAKRETEALLAKIEKADGNAAVISGGLGLFIIILGGRVLPCFVDIRDMSWIFKLSAYTAILLGGFCFVASLSALPKTKGRAIVGLLLTALTIYNALCLLIDLPTGR